MEIRLSDIIPEKETGLERKIEDILEELRAKDTGTFLHSIRVSLITGLIAENMDIKEKEYVDDLRLGALLHDLGKMHIPSEILLKPTILTSEEYEIVKTHTRYELKVMRPSDALSVAAQVIYEHHERWDGSGFPYKLKGHEISLAGRIVAVADSFDAMRAERPYKKKIPFEDVVAEIKGSSGIKYDSDVVEAFLKCAEEADRITTTDFTFKP